MKKQELSYPRLEEDKVLVILDDYSGMATGQELRLDFSEVQIEQLAREAIACITRKYLAKSASPTYLRVLVPAVVHFSVFARENGLESFLDYDDAAAEAYDRYLEELCTPDGEHYSLNYRRYLRTVPNTMKNNLLKEPLTD